MAVDVIPAQYVITLNQSEFNAVRSVMRRAKGNKNDLYPRYDWETAIKAFDFDFDPDEYDY